MAQIKTEQGGFGLERETLRVDAQGRLAQTAHPFEEDGHITRDFCENQIELVTPVCASVQEAVEALAKLDRQAREVLEAQGEHIWLYSNPPHFENEDEIPIAQFDGDFRGKRHYREALEKRYGKRLMLFSGVHFNYSFPEALLRAWHGGNGDFKSFRDATYLRLYKQLVTHSWLLVLLTAASPYYDRSFDGDGLSGVVKSEFASIRNSVRGYWNQFVPILDHTDLRAFTESIGKYVEEGKLFSASELYLPIRLKPRGVNSLEALAEGVDHIELRMFDLDPHTTVGVDADALEFAHLLILYLAQQPDFDLTPERQVQAVRDHQAAALFAPPEELIERGKQIISDMKAFFAEDASALQVIASQSERLHGKRLCEAVRAESIYTA